MIKIPAGVEMDELVVELCDQLDKSELIDLIKMIDQDVASYDFTCELRDYFEEEIRRDEEFINEE